MASSTVNEWTTAIATERDDDFVVRGVSMLSLIGRASYADVLFLVLSGRLPDDNQRRVLDALLISTVESGLSPSNMVARMYASYGVPLQVGLGAGVLTFGDWHGGAGEELARDLHDRIAVLPDPDRADDATLDGLADGFIRAAKATGEPIPGFGHPRGTDARVLKIVALAEECQVLGAHTRLALAVERRLEASVGRAVPLNLDGLAASLLLDLGLPWQAARLMIIAPRVVGMTAHFIEELEQGHRWRHIPRTSVAYVGPEPDGVGE